MKTEFTPLMSLIGGMLLGLGAVTLMVMNGRIAGVSGILSRFMPPVTDRSDIPTAIAFIIGLLLAAPLLTLLTGSLPASTMVASPWLLIIAGLFVGFGTGTGSGCTSGHGVCGLSRFSYRSLAATLTFMLMAAITVYLIRHVL